MSEKKVIQEGKTHAPWQREFYKNIDGFVELGVDRKDAHKLLQKFMQMSSTTPLPRVMETFREPSALEEVGVYTERDDEIRDFMIEFFKPLLSRFTLEGKENIELIADMMGKFPITLVANHLSHFDTAAMYCMLYLAGGKARKIADSMVFIAGRLVFLPDFTRTALYMINSLLVCSKRDMAENPTMGDVMTRINMRSFRQAQALQKEGKIIAVFPEGTRSRTGKLLKFVDTVYHYVSNKVILPVSLTNTDKILPAESFLFNAVSGKVTIGRPFVVGRLPAKIADQLPNGIDSLDIPETVANKKQFIIDSLALYIGQNLSKHKHGSYRNLYKAIPGKTKAPLIETVRDPLLNVVVIGHSGYGTAAATILANKDVNIKIFIPDAEKAAVFNEQRVDETNFPHFKLPPNIEFTADRGDVEEGTLFIQAVRPWEIDDYYSKIADQLKKSKGAIINVIKGFTGSKYGLIFDDLEKVYGIDPVRFAALAGANYPEQVMERKFTGYELAAINTSLVNPLVDLFNTGYISCRPALNPYDVRGVQLGGALRNIYALGIGLLDGYYETNLGGNSDNSLFHISSELFKEMKRIGVALGGQERTFDGLSGLTDLMFVSFGQDARDRQFGHDFFMGTSGDDKELAGLFGIRFLPNLIDLDEKKYPLMNAIYSILIKKKDKQKIISSIMDDYQKSVMLV